MGIFMGIFDHSSRSTFVRSHTDVGQEGLALSLRSRVQWQRALHHCIQHFALHLLIYGLDAAARPWKPVP